MAVGSLSDVAIKNAKPRAKPYKLSDGGGMFLSVQPAGSKYWRLKYRVAGREKLLALGVYPDVSLKLAREKRDAARKQLAEGVDPGQAKKIERDRLSGAQNFEAVAKEWFAKKSPVWGEGHAKRVTDLLERDVYPHIGQRAVDELTAPTILSMLRRIEARGALEQMRRCKTICQGVMAYAVATGRAERNPVADLRGAFESRPVRHHASITEPKAVGRLLRAINDYEGFFATQCALQLLPLLFVRPGELRKAEWSEFDLDAREWRIPAHKMKMKEQHIVPLSEQALAILRRLHEVTGRGKLVFPGVRHHDKPISENTLNAALRYIGYTKHEMTGHGFRSMASTLLNELGWNRDAIERQLAHSERDRVRAAYNYAEHLSERRSMMQSWANYLDGLANGADVVGFSRRAS
jgi:integrase